MEDQYYLQSAQDIERDEDFCRMMIKALYNYYQDLQIGQLFTLKMSDPTHDDFFSVRLTGFANNSVFDAVSVCISPFYNSPSNTETIYSIHLVKGEEFVNSPILYPYHQFNSFKLLWQEIERLYKFSYAYKEIEKNLSLI